MSVQRRFSKAVNNRRFCRHCLWKLARKSRNSQTFRSVAVGFKRFRVLKLLNCRRRVEGSRIKGLRLKGFRSLGFRGFHCFN